MSQGELAEAIGTHQGTVSEWESDDARKIQRSNLLAIARVTGRTVEWLKRGDTPPTVRESAQRGYIAINGGASEAAARLDALAADLELQGIIQPGDAAQLREVADHLRGEGQDRARRLGG